MTCKFLSAGIVGVRAAGEDKHVLGLGLSNFSFLTIANFRAQGRERIRMGGLKRRRRKGRERKGNRVSQKLSELNLTYQ